MQRMPHDARGPRSRLVSRGSLAAVLIVLVALALRLPGLDHLPPAIHQDEASNVVDGWSLLQDGVDRAGRVWPVFLEGFGKGDNRTSLYAVLTIPAVALLGPGAPAARLPAALIGVWTVLALYLFTRRVRGDGAALWAAGLLAVNPWHVYLSRFGHEASLTPAFLITALWLVGGTDTNATPSNPRRRPFGGEARLGRGCGGEAPGSSWPPASIAIRASASFSR